MRKRKNFRKRPKDDSKGLSVKVWNNNVEGALKVFKRKVKDSNLFMELREKEFYEKPSKKRKRGEKPAKKGDKNYPKTLDIEGKLAEAKFKKIILPNDKKSQTITSKIIRKMNLRYQKDYNMLAHGSGPLKAKGGNQVIMILPKHYNKFIELAMKNKLNPRG